jgi:carbonic anhydrase
MEPAENPAATHRVCGEVADVGWWEDLMLANRRFSEAGIVGYPDARPARQLAVVTCMDARIDVFRSLGLVPGDAHIVRNAGARVTDDVLRSLIISQAMLGTRSILLMPHTGCGLLGVTNAEVAAAARRQLGRDPGPMDFRPIGDLEDTVRADARYLRASGLLHPDVDIRAAIYDVATGVLKPVDWQS